jgi:hypothetical protein
MSFASATSILTPEFQNQAIVSVFELRDKFSSLSFVDDCKPKEMCGFWTETFVTSLIRMYASLSITPVERQTYGHVEGVSGTFFVQWLKST